jgi:hypothetical protein
VLQLSRTLILIRSDHHHGRLAVLGDHLRLASSSFDDFTERILCVLNGPNAKSHGLTLWPEIPTI